MHSIRNPLDLIQPNAVVAAVVEAGGVQAVSTKALPGDCNKDIISIR